MAEPAALVVVIPGIGGTMLAEPGKLDAPLWSAKPRDLDILFNPDRLSLAEHKHLEPVGLVPDRKAFGVWTVVHGYDALLRRLAAKHDLVLDDGKPEHRNLDATLVAFGYDFRRSIAEAA